MRGSGVTITALCPGATQTAFFTADGAEKATLITRVPLPTAQNVAQKGWAAMKAGKRVYVPGVMNKISAFSPRLAPRVLSTWITGMVLKRRW
jgi:short-subunit dehydrogenase